MDFSDRIDELAKSGLSHGPDEDDMESNEERRDPRLLRVPLERVEVELAHEAFDDVFEADGIDVGEGGLALRSAILPDVGARLRCAFASPLDGESIVADGEVVWAHDSGPHLGEFGVRFEGLDEASEASLRRIIEDHEDRALTQQEADALGWPSSPGTIAAPTDEDPNEDEEVYGGEYAPETIALELDGVASELIAEVVHTADDAMLVEQALPFLRLGTGLTTEDGRRGSIEGVELRIDDDTPRLVLTVVFTNTASGPSLALDVDTVPDAQLPFHTEEIVVKVTQAPSVIVEETVEEDVPVVTRSRPVREAEPAKKREATETFRIPREAEVEAYDPPTPRDRALSALDTLRADVFPAVARALATFVLFVKRLYGMAAPRVTGAARAVHTRATNMSTSLRAQPRRTTSRPRAEASAPQPRRRTQGGRQSVEELPVAVDFEARKRKNRIVLGLAAATVLIGAVGLLSEETPIAPPPAVPAPVVAAPVAAPEPVVMPVAAPVPEPVAVEPTGGPIAQPTFPTLGDDSAAASDATTASSVTPTPRATSFGAATVPNGQTFILEMTTPVEAVEGEETATGFRVRLTHTNSNSRASPIAQQHPRVDRASIMNQGENAELRIDFLAGRKPVYRVEARGRRLHVTLSR